MYIETSKELLRFIEKSPTSFHAVENMAQELLREGYIELKEEEEWKPERGKGYFVTRNHSSLAAFFIPENDVHSFHIMASHTDSPAFKIKEKPELKVENTYIKLNVEKYGGMLMAQWLDRPLSAAGRVIVEEKGELKEKLINIDRDLMVIPSLAIHMNRQANEGVSLNPQTDTLPLLAMCEEGTSFMKMIAEEAQTEEERILGHDLFLYNRVPGTIWGANSEFISSGRLDDLQCAFASLKGFIKGKKEKHICVHAVFDNEEVGSETRQGAASTFLKDTLIRLNMALGRSYEDYLRSLAAGFMISADNAHAVHPNYADKTDPGQRPYINQGIVIKFNANQKYCTDAYSAAKFRQICRRADVPFQTFVNRSDMAGGSTLGNISGTQVAVSTVDIGLPQLSMHSPYESAGVKDTLYLIKAAETFFE